MQFTCLAIILEFILKLARAGSRVANAEMRWSLYFVTFEVV